MQLGEEASGKDVVAHEETAVELRLCKICLESKPLNCFPLDLKTMRPKGCFCTPCGAGVESLQRVLRQKWGSSYKDKYAQFRKNHDQWRSTALSFSKDPQNQKKRGLKLTEDKVEE
eukprot:2873718-Amphidinium_carterae.1